MSPRYDVPKAAPEPLRAVQQFINSVDLENEHRLAPDWLDERARSATSSNGHASCARRYGRSRSRTTASRSTRRRSRSSTPRRRGCRSSCRRRRPASASAPRATSSTGSSPSPSRRCSTAAGSGSRRVATATGRSTTTRRTDRRPGARCSSAGIERRRAPTAAARPAGRAGRERALGGLALAFTPGFNVANIGAVADRTAHAYGVGLARRRAVHDRAVRHARRDADPGRPALRPLRSADRRRRRAARGRGRVRVGASVARGVVRDRDAARRRRRDGGGVRRRERLHPRRRSARRSPRALYGAVSVAAGGLALALVPLWGTWRAPFAARRRWSPRRGVLLVALAPKGGRVSRRGAVARVFDRRLRPLAVMHSASFGLSVVVGNWVVTLLERAGGESDARRRRRRRARPVRRRGLASARRAASSTARRSFVRASSLGGVAVALLAVARPLPLVVVCAVAGFAAGIPFAPSFAGAQRTAARCAGGRDRRGQHGCAPRDPRRDAAARARLLAAGRRACRLRRPCPALGGRGAHAPTLIEIVAPGRSRRNNCTSSVRGSDTQPLVGWPRSSCRKIADPRPGTAGCVLYSMSANSR